MKPKPYQLTASGIIFLKRVQKAFPEYKDSLIFWWDKKNKNKNLKKNIQRSTNE